RRGLERRCVGTARGGEDDRLRAAGTRRAEARAEAQGHGRRRRLAAAAFDSRFSTVVQLFRVAGSQSRLPFALSRARRPAKRSRLKKRMSPALKMVVRLTSLADEER